MTTLERVDTLEELYERGRIAAGNLDQGRWEIGDIACTIETHYAGHDIADFARQINVPSKRVMEYRTVAKYYDFLHRQNFLDENPMITYSHMRAAMRFDGVARSLAFLESEVSSNGLTVEATQKLIKKRLGKPANSSLLLSVIVTSIRSYNRRAGEITLVIDAKNLNDADAFIDYYREQGNKQPVRMAIREVS